MILTLPFPPAVLNPNVRRHWSVKAKAARAYRVACWALAKEARLTLPETEKIHLWADFYPPDRRNRDDDNAYAAFKSGRDGLADALGIDDNRFVFHPYMQDKVGGYVKVRLTAGPVGVEAA